MVETTAVVPRPFPVLDPTGKVRAWLDAGRRLAVWRSLDLSTVGREWFTPGDVTTPPHWSAGKVPAVVLDVAEVSFYVQSSTLADYSDTPAGARAAERYQSRAIDAAERREPFGYAAGAFHDPARPLPRYSVENIEVRGPDRGDGLPVYFAYRYAVVQWVAVAGEVPPRSPDRGAVAHLAHWYGMSPRPEGRAAVVARARRDLAAAVVADGAEGADDARTLRGIARMMREAGRTLGHAETLDAIAARLDGSEDS